MPHFQFQHQFMLGPPRISFVHLVWSLLRGKLGTKACTYRCLRSC